MFADRGEKLSPTTTTINALLSFFPVFENPDTKWTRRRERTARADSGIVHNRIPCQRVPSLERAQRFILVLYLIETENITNAVCRVVRARRIL